MRRHLLIMGLCCWVTSGMANIAPIASTQVDTSALAWSQFEVTAYTKLPEAQQDVIAKTWGLTPAEYSRYLYLMQQTDNGLFYGKQQLDPCWILAMNSKDTAEQRKLTVLAVQRERARLDKLLAFEKLFQQVQNELYPNQLPINTPLAKPAATKVNIALNDRILFFTSLNSSDNKLIQELLEKTVRSHSQVKVDIFLVGNVTDVQIQQWAKQQGIPPKLTQEGLITLNRDSGRFEQLTQGKASMPSAFINRFGKLYLMNGLDK